MPSRAQTLTDPNGFVSIHACVHQALHGALELVRLLAEAASGQLPKLHFVPHSGPFARGIHMTVQAAAPGVDISTVRAAFDATDRGFGRNAVARVDVPALFVRAGANRQSGQ